MLPDRPQAKRWLPAFAALAALLVTAAVFRKPATTVVSTDEVLGYAAVLARADTATPGWTRQTLLQKASNADIELNIDSPPQDLPLAVGTHSLFPYRFLTIREPAASAILVVLAEPYPPLPSREHRLVSESTISSSRVFLIDSEASSGWLHSQLRSPDG